MSNIILPTESNKRIYNKFKTYEDENFIKISRWFSDQLEKIFSTEDYETIVQNYIDQIEKPEGIVFNFEFQSQDANEKDLKENILSEITQEDFTNTIIRTAYKIAKADVFEYDELEGDEY